MENIHQPQKVDTNFSLPASSSMLKFFLTMYFGCNYFNFKGRASRREWWSVAILETIFLIIPIAVLMYIFPDYADYIRDLVFDPRVVLERYKLRDLFMRKAEVLLHGDFHTSNVFVDQEELKVIDMEYAFFGPAAYDLGYQESHLLSQVTCGAFRPFPSEEERWTFISYTLATMQHLFDEYCRVFFECWDADAKPIYQGVPGLQEHVKKQLLKNMIGYCSSSNLFRCAGGHGNYPEYDDLTDSTAQRNAVILSIMMDHRMILCRDDYNTIQEWIDDLLNLLKEFIAKF